MKNNKVINNVKKFSQDRQSLGNKNKSMSEKAQFAGKNKQGVEFDEFKEAALEYFKMELNKVLKTGIKAKNFDFESVVDSIIDKDFSGLNKYINSNNMLDEDKIELSVNTQLKDSNNSEALLKKDDIFVGDDKDMKICESKIDVVVLESPSINQCNGEVLDNPFIEDVRSDGFIQFGFSDCLSSSSDSNIEKSRKRKKISRKNSIAKQQLDLPQTSLFDLI